MTDLNLTDRLDRIEQFENELIRNGTAIFGATIFGARAGLSHADFFIIRALRRTLAQAFDFRDSIKARNFPCAAATLRLQLDTAMQVNALSFVNDPDVVCKAVLDGEQFNRLKDRDGNELSDVHIRKKLAEEHPWISSVYERTSDFIHLSGRHFDISITRTDDETRIAYFQISGHDPSRSEETYFEAVDRFFEATKLAGTLILAFWMARHRTVSQGIRT